MFDPPNFTEDDKLNKTEKQIWITAFVHALMNVSEEDKSLPDNDRFLPENAAKSAEIASKTVQAFWDVQNNDLSKNALNMYQAL